MLLLVRQSSTDARDSRSRRGLQLTVPISQSGFSFWGPVISCCSWVGARSCSMTGKISQAVSFCTIKLVYWSAIIVGCLSISFNAINGVKKKKNSSKQKGDWSLIQEEIQDCCVTWKWSLKIERPLLRKDGRGEGVQTRGGK